MPPFFGISMCVLHQITVDNMINTRSTASNIQIIVFVINTVFLNLHTEWGLGMSKPIWKSRDMSECIFFFETLIALTRTLQQIEQHKGGGALLPKA
jgi:hypothetical protein